jgi:hypothetical protein
MTPLIETQTDAVDVLSTAAMKLDTLLSGEIPPDKIEGFCLLLDGINQEIQGVEAFFKKPPG